MLPRAGDAELEIVSKRKRFSRLSRSKTRPPLPAAICLQAGGRLSMNGLVHSSTATPSSSRELRLSEATVSASDLRASSRLGYVPSE